MTENLINRKNTEYYIGIIHNLPRPEPCPPYHILFLYILILSYLISSHLIPSQIFELISIDIQAKREKDSLF